MMIEYVLRGQAKSLAEVPDGARIEAINDVEVVAMCGGCGKPILEGQKRYGWADEVWTCAKCGGPAEAAV
jgi:hypothetical protein